MPKLYIEQVPMCESGHVLWRLSPSWGFPTAGLWVCTVPDCPNFEKQLVVPHLVVEALSVGPAYKRKCWGCDTDFYPWQCHTKEDHERMERDRKKEAGNGTA